jgi:hypothetical protein
VHPRLANRSNSAVLAESFDRSFQWRFLEDEHGVRKVQVDHYPPLTASRCRDGGPAVARQGPPLSIAPRHGTVSWDTVLRWDAKADAGGFGCQGHLVR